MEMVEALVPLKAAMRKAVGEEEAGALASDEAIRVSGLSQGGWGSRKRGRLALGKVRAAAAAAPVPPAAATSGAATSGDRPSTALAAVRRHGTAHGAEIAGAAGREGFVCGHFL